ncbi:MAG: hypothetical protein ACD_33C00045G0026 [uncultured bacterium]|nr:MAG: hypothetical protein ACD_33C00045G0026 [uncultured bacterium]
MVKNLVDNKFGRLTVIYDSGKRTSGRMIIWTCKCDCGNIINVCTGSLNSGNTKSCGCLQKDYVSNTGKNNITHGLSNTLIYKNWSDIIQRCNNPNNPAYIYYGARGIKICDKWLQSFEAFYTDMGVKPSSHHSIDRKDNNGNYEPNNCKWSTQEEQCNNKSNNVILNYKGKKYTISQLAKEYNISYSKLHQRLRCGWSLEDAIETSII